MNLRTSLLAMLGTAVVFTILVVVLSVYHVLDLVSSVTAILVMLIALVGYQIVRRPGSRFAPDERIRRIDSRATVWSWTLTLTGVSLLFIMDRFRVFSITYGQLLVALVIFMPYSKLLTRVVLRRMPDVRE
jgi:uncharacterized membrane protein